MSTETIVTGSEKWIWDNTKTASSIVVSADGISVARTDPQG